MRNFNIGMLALGLAFSAGAMAEAAPTISMSQDMGKASEDQIKAQYKADKESCSSMSGNTKDICIAEAKGREKVANAELDARRNNTEKTRYGMLVTKAEAQYAVAKERCDDRSGNDKDVCLKDAKAAMVAAKADAKTQLKTSEAMEKADDQSIAAQMKANEKAMDVREDAIEDKQDANYAAAKERCDTLAATAKDTCVNEAKERYGKL